MLRRIKGWMQGVEHRADRSASAGSAPRLNILMVCSGNICRSPTAEAVLRAHLKRAGLPGVQVDSAGTHGFHISEPPDPRAQAAALRRGYDLSKLRARPVTEADYGKFDWFLAMDETHRAWLRQRIQPNQPQQPTTPDPLRPPPQVRLLLDHARRYKGTKEVPDPYYGSPEGFERVLDLVEDACEGLVQDLMFQRAGR